MAEIIDFNRLFKESHLDSQEDSQQEHQSQNLSIPKGAYVKLIGKIKDDVLRNDMMLPMVPKEQQNQMLEYHSRYAIAQGIDEILKRVQADENLSGHPITITIYPQEVVHEKNFNQDKLITTFELGLPIMAKATSDCEFEA